MHIQSPEELVRLGEKIYFEKQQQLEKSNFGDYAVIEVNSKEIFINNDKLSAIQEARQKYPDKLLYIVQIGKFKQDSNSELNELKRYGWSF